MSGSKLNSIVLSRGRALGFQAPSIATTKHEIAWRGFAYLEGVPCGEPSIRKFALGIESNLPTAAGALKGIYFVAVREKATNRTFAFVDCSGLYHAYYSPHCVGTSFLDLVSSETLRPADLDPDAVAEFLQFGCIYDGRTFFSQIRKIDPDMIVEACADGATATYKKPIADISEPPQRTLEDLLRSLSQSIANERVSLDLTGGIDSRLLATAVSYFGIPFELAASGVEGTEDLEIAEQVAGVLGRDFFVTRHEPGRTNWNDLFAVSDGLFDLSKSDRSLQLQQDRVARGVTLAMSGAGGELFKDFWWLQDFPFYARKRPNLERLYAMRFAPGKMNTGILSDRYRTAVARNRERILAMMSRCAVASNTKTYDRVYYELKMREFAGRFLTNSSKVLPFHAPYLDREAVRVGYNLGVGERFFNRYHRRLITKWSPKVARMATTEGGMSASSAAKDVSNDLIKYVLDRFSRLKTKLNQRQGRATKVAQGPDSADLPVILREICASRKSTQRLQDYGILSKDAAQERLSTNLVGSVVALDMLIERLESYANVVIPAEYAVQQPA